MSDQAKGGESKALNNPPYEPSHNNDNPLS